MTKFMRMVEQNLPGSDFRDHLDLIMEFKTAVNALHSSKKCNFKIIPVEGKEGTIELKHDDGRSCLLNLKANEEAEDPAMKSTPTTGELAANLVKKDVRVQRSLEPVISKVTRELSRYATS